MAHARFGETLSWATLDTDCRMKAEFATGRQPRRVLSGSN